MFGDSTDSLFDTGYKNLLSTLALNPGRWTSSAMSAAMGARLEADPSEAKWILFLDRVDALLAVPLSRLARRSRSTSRTRTKVVSLREWTRSRGVR